MAEMRIGAQLFTLRDHCKTLEDFTETMNKLKAIGYTAVQFSALGPIEAEDLAKVLDDTGLSCVATHVGWQSLIDETDEQIRRHRLWGCKHAAIGGLPGEYFTPEGLDRFVNELPPVVEKLNAAGIDFSYHNHNHELAKLPNGKTWLGELYARTSPEHLKAEIDTYWITAGGGSPAAWINSLAGRMPLLHVKDMCVTPDREQRMAEIGQGNLDWPGIIEAAGNAGVEEVLVEQDQTYGRDPFESMEISYKFLSGMGLK